MARDTVITLSLRAADPLLEGQELLSDGEHERLAGMHVGARPAFVTARGMLRRRLATYMGVTPKTVPLVQAAAGRITIEGFADDEPPFYSVSHTGTAEHGIAGVAVTDMCPIGIDVQQIDASLNWKRIAERRFPPKEYALLSALPEQAARTLFFTLWSIKEAFVKLEDGKLMPYLRSIELVFADGQFSLAEPTPNGNTEASIFVSAEPEHNIVVACVSAKDVKVELDSKIRSIEIQPNSLENRPEL